MKETSSNKFKRVCLGCKELFNKKVLLKIILDKVSKGLLLDQKQNIPGRSIYVYPSSRCLNKLEKSLKSSKKFKSFVFSSEKNEEIFKHLSVKSLAESCPCEKVISAEVDNV
ncbi:MAG: DUF448 domain-containing protein [Candidatus Caenarcaniphilales bacterium]|nr:DUF448 domain-containing protein [Candidatus Caenarcaniphilales bacterium]